MSGWVAKRFWKQAQAVSLPEGFSITLDEKPVKTPAKAALILPTHSMAQALADEWQAQTDRIRPETMPMTRYANSAIDKVAPQFDAVVGEVSGFGATDLLCYRAAGPERLRARQDAEWDPPLAWISGLGAPLQVVTGVMPVEQPAASLATLRTHVSSVSVYELAALHDLVSISGSLILGLGLTLGKLDPDQALRAARIDEDWQTELWGEDDEAQIQAAQRAADFAAAWRFFGLCR